MSGRVHPTFYSGKSIVTCATKLRSRQLLSSPLRRQFHASPNTRSLDTYLLFVHDRIYDIHNLTNLPWVASIPLTAILVRVVCVTPLSIFAEIIRRRRRNLTPLLSAWRHFIIRGAMKSRKGDMNITLAKSGVDREMNTLTKELFQRWRAPTWGVWLPFLQFPVWLSVIECIRRMCGARESWLWLLAQGSEGMASSTQPSEGSSTEIEQLISVDPSLAMEGGLWFPNLLVPDPTLTLPFVLMGTYYLGMYVSKRIAPPRMTPPTTFQTRMEKGFKMAFLAIVPLTLNVPAGIMVYMIAGSFFASIQGVLIHLLLPFKSSSFRARKALGKEQH